MRKTLTTSIVLVSTLLGLLPLAPVASAYEKGDWLIRGRIVNVNPNDDSNSITGLPGSKVSVDDDTMIEADFTYMLSSNFGLELIATVTEHDVKGAGSISGLGNILSAKVLPPSLLLQYHFSPNERFRPYAGLGINYTTFFDEDSTSSLDSALGKTDVDMDDSWGVALQIGADMEINPDWFINMDFKYIDMDTKAELNSDGVKRKVDVDIDPWIIGFGIGRRF